MCPEPSATITLTDVQFQPWSPGNFTTTRFSMIEPVAGFSLEDETLIIKVPAGQTVKVIFQLPDPDYVLLGVAFNPNQADVPGSRAEFPEVDILRTPPVSQLTLTDNSLKMFSDVDFNYVILIQQVETGQIGVIDPDIINEPEN